MKQNLRFFENGGSWFADVEGHTLAENQMVAGADTFLQYVDRIVGGNGEVSINFSDSHNESEDGPYLAVLSMRAHNQWGATYTLSGPMADLYSATGFELWICNVTHDVLGEHPRNIYIYSINK